MRAQVCCRSPLQRLISHPSPPLAPLRSPCRWSALRHASPPACATPRGWATRWWWPRSASTRTGCARGRGLWRGSCLPSPARWHRFLGLCQAAHHTCLPSAPALCMRRRPTTLSRPPSQKPLLRPSLPFLPQAVELGLDAIKRASLRTRLQAARDTCPLFDTRRWVRTLACIWDRSSRGQLRLRTHMAAGLPISLLPRLAAAHPPPSVLFPAHPWRRCATLRRRCSACGTSTARAAAPTTLRCPTSSRCSRAEQLSGKEAAPQLSSAPAMKAPDRGGPAAPR